MHFLSLEDFTAEEIENLFDLTNKLKKKVEKSLESKTLLLLFEKSSTRTRVSFEVAMNKLGGRSIFMRPDQLQLARGEPIKDTARVLSGYGDACAARLKKHSDLLELAKWSSIPVINALTNKLHPCQALADLYTIKKEKGKLRNCKLSWIGDGNNVCNSLLLGCSLMGMNAAVACPKGYEPSKEILKKAKEIAPKMIEIFHNPSEAVKNSDLIYTDVWISMGKEKEKKKRLKDFEGFQVNKQLMQKAPKALFMHCLPAKRGQEVTNEVLESRRSIVWKQAENRLHTEKALLLWLLGK